MSIQSGVNAIVGTIYRSFDRSKASIATENMKKSRAEMKAQKAKYARPKL